MSFFRLFGSGILREKVEVNIAGWPYSVGVLLIAALIRCFMKQMEWI